MATLKNLTINDTGYIQLPAGTTAQRPGTPSVGMLRYNSDISALEVYTGAWTTVSSLPPDITTVSPTTYNGAQGSSFTINGTNFTGTSSVFFVTADGTEYAATATSYITTTQLTATTPQNFTVAQGPLGIKVVTSGGNVKKTGLIDCGHTPAWSSPAAGSLGTWYDAYRTLSITLVAGDVDVGAVVTYSIVSGALPSGVTLASSTGVLSGTAASVGTNTTYNFTVRATDNAGNTSDRAFSITVNAPVTTVFSYTGADQSFTVPAGVTKVLFKLWGAGGSGQTTAGANGGFTQATLGTSPGTVYTLIVGQGTYLRDGGINYGGGAKGYSDTGNGAGDGGGRSAVRISTTELLTAGGGGGGAFSGGTAGGTGGGLIGVSVVAAGVGGSGGTQTAGGAGGVGSGGTAVSGSQYTGGTSTSGYAGGGGGGGYYGGGGGAGTNNNHCGGGGGSGWVGRNGSTTLSGNEYGSVATPADSTGRTDTVSSVTYYNAICIRGNNSTDANFATGIGVGNVGAAGGNGRIVVIY